MEQRPIPIPPLNVENHNLPPIELNLQQFLRGGGTPLDLENKFAIKSKRHQLFQNLVMFKYNQIDSPFKEPIVQECRGIILNESNDWSIVCWSFSKFFNYGDQLAASINWRLARVEEKLDGSLCQLYYYENDWHVASSGVPDASGNVMSTQITQMGDTFANLFWRTWKSLDLRLPSNKNFTYTFELMTPQNRVVVPHQVAKLALLGVRNNITGEQYRTYYWSEFYPIVREFPLQSWDECLKSASTMDPMNQEGFVVVDENWNRVKIKSPPYVAMSLIKNSACSPKYVLDIVRTGESTEFLIYFPEWKPTFDDVTARFNALVTQIECDYELLRHIQSQKEFALSAVKTECSAALFQLRNGKAKTVREFLAKINIKSLIGLLSIEDVEVVMIQGE